MGTMTSEEALFWLMALGLLVLFFLVWMVAAIEGRKEGSQQGYRHGFQAGRRLAANENLLGELKKSRHTRSDEYKEVLTDFENLIKPKGIKNDKGLSAWERVLWLIIAFLFAIMLF